MKNQSAFSIFVVEDDAWYSSMLEYCLSLNPDYNVKCFASATEFYTALHEKPHVVTLDYSLPDATGAEVLEKVREISPDTNVIVISAQSDVKTAIELLKKGAKDYLVKDEDVKERLLNIIQTFRENTELKYELEQLKKEVGKKYEFSKDLSKYIVGNSIVMRRVFSLMEKAAKTNITVSITGETGTGKELVAKSIHYNSLRKNQNFIAVNLAAIPKDLVESELFGHEKGAFTGAVARRIGKFEEANKGTLFLDEIGEMDLNIQAKLLRALQEREVTRVGSNEVIKFDVRIICATNKNLLEEVRKGNFREDLYYRLLGLPIHLPALRERDNDTLLISKFFIESFCRENNLPQKTIHTSAKKRLLAYPFPGNIRELKSTIELACVMSDERTEILEEHLNISGTDSFGNIVDQNISLREFNNKLIQHYLEKYSYDVIKVAKKLQIGKSTIYRMIQNRELRVSNKSYSDKIIT